MTRLELRAISKRYAGVAANESISMSVEAGRIHAVLGENGAGKSTLMKIIYGAAHADSGEMLWEGRAVTVASPADARRLGIGMVYQHFSLFETVSVVENIALTTGGAFDLPALARRLGELGTRFGLEVDPWRRVHLLSLGERQRVEILRCLLQSPKLLILDEPTSVLTPQSTRQLFVVLRRLAEDGCSILYISHKLDEIRELCSSATVLRAGRVVATVDPRGSSEAELAALMVGSGIPALSRPPASREATPRLELRGLTVQPEDPAEVGLSGLSLAVHGGEILGIAGVSGNGQGALMAALAHELPADAQQIRIDGRDAGAMDIRARRALGFALVPEDRLGRASVPQLSLAESCLLSAADRHALVRRGLIRRGKVREFARAVIERFDVRCRGPSAPAMSLSGGNLQKFIVGRELMDTPRVLVIAQPTWGVDVAAAAFLRQQLVDLSRAGAAILLISEDLEEILEVCDRIAVLYRGRLSQARTRESLGLEQIGQLMAGVGEDPGVQH